MLKEFFGSLNKWQITKILFIIFRLIKINKITSSKQSVICSELLEFTFIIANINLLFY